MADLFLLLLFCFVFFTVIHTCEIPHVSQVSYGPAQIVPVIATRESVGGRMWRPVRTDRRDPESVPGGAPAFLHLTWQTSGVGPTVAPLDRNMRRNHVTQKVVAGNREGKAF